jgi:hypothetical protein
MGEIVYYQTTCPRCLRVTPVPYTRTELEAMLGLGHLITLFSPCHNHSWRASKSELRALRELLEGPAVFAPKYPEGRQPETWEYRTHAMNHCVDLTLCTFVPAKAAND